MMVTGYIEEVFPFSYEKGGKMYHKKHVLVSYPFYSQVNKILFTVNDQLVLPQDWAQQYTFSFDAVTKFSHQKVFTDFYLHQISPALKVNEEAYLVLIDTKFCKQDLRILKEEEVKGRVKNTAVLRGENEETLHVFYWKDNHFLQELDKTATVQLNCRSLQYKDRWINNIEIWRTVENDDFMGSIVL